MKTLELAHHKLIMLFLAIIVLVLGVFFGVRILASSGQDGMMVILFGLLFLHTMFLYVIFTQLVHLRDDLAQTRRRK